MSWSSSSRVCSIAECSPLPLPFMPAERRQFKQRPCPTRDVDPQFAQTPDSFSIQREAEPTGELIPGTEHKARFECCQRKFINYRKIIQSGFYLAGATSDRISMARNSALF